MKPQFASLTVEGVLPLTINRLLVTHWAKRRKLAEEFGWLMRAAITKQDIRRLKAWKDWGYKLKITAHVVTPQMYDSDNLASIGKWPLDIMRKFEWIENDDPEHVEFSATQERGKLKSITFRIAPIVPEEKP